MLEMLQLLEGPLLLIEKLASMKDDPSGKKSGTPTSKPVDILREKIAGGQPSEIKEALKLVADEGINLSELFTQDVTMLRALGSRLARTEGNTELSESLTAFGEHLLQIVKIKNANGNTLVSETLFFAEAHKTAARQLKSVLTKLKKSGADLEGAAQQLQADSLTAAAIRGMVDVVKKGAGWFKQNE